MIKTFVRSASVLLEICWQQVDLPASDVVGCGQSNGPSIQMVVFVFLVGGVCGRVFLAVGKRL